MIRPTISDNSSISLPQSLKNDPKLFKDEADIRFSRTLNSCKVPQIRYATPERLLQRLTGKWKNWKRLLSFNTSFIEYFKFHIIWRLFFCNLYIHIYILLSCNAWLTHFPDQLFCLIIKVLIFFIKNKWYIKQIGFFRFTFPFNWLPKYISSYLPCIYGRSHRFRSS